MIDTHYKGGLVGSPEYFIKLNDRNFMECVAWPLSTHKHYASVKKMAWSINRILLEVFHDFQKSEQIRYCVHPDWWGILFELLSDLDNIVKMVGGSSSYEEIVKLVKSGIEGNRAEVSASEIDKLRDIKTVISNQYSVNHADIVVRELRKAVQYGIAGITDVKLRKALSNVYKGALQLMKEQEFWEGLLAMYMYCSTDSNYNRYFKGSSNILICSENYFFYIVERAIGRRWTYEDNHFFVELKNDFYEILEIVKEDLNRGLQNDRNLKQENADRLSEFFDDIEKLGFSVIGGRGLLKEFRFEEQGKDLNDIWDKVTIDRILSLHPSIRQNTIGFILDVQHRGINLRIADGYRTIAEQNALYEQGRTTPGKRVTNARGGSSYHNYGLAIDVYEIKNGQVVWDVLPQWVVDIATGYGFEWGGYWTDPYDPPHFQMVQGYSTNDLLKKVNQGNVDEKGYVKL